MEEGPVGQEEEEFWHYLQVGLGQRLVEVEERCHLAGCLVVSRMTRRTWELEDCSLFGPSRGAQDGSRTRM